MEGEMVGGRYHLVRRLGVSAMSDVWLATDLELGREVAFKRLGAGADPARFAREAHAAAALTHPHVCQVYDYGRVGGATFMVLEYLPGGTLRDRLTPGEPLPTDEAARILAEEAGGLA